MLGMALLHREIKKSCGKLHKKICLSLLDATEALLNCRELTLTNLGRSMKNNAKTKHNIKRVDRLLSNETLWSYRENIYQMICHAIIGYSNWIPLLVDVCYLTPDSEFQVLRACVPNEGRALTIYEIVYRQGELHQIQKKFLKKLKQLLPSEAHVVLITDAGFYSEWFKQVQRQGWDWIGRIRQNTQYALEGKAWKACRLLHPEAKTKPHYVGEVELSKKNAIRCYLHSVKKKLKGRIRKNRKGKVHQGSYSRIHAQGQKEPWILATSLCVYEFDSEKIVALYKLRMQIEESFRDMKNSRYGFGLRNSLTRSVNRLSILLLINLLGTLVAWLIGKALQEKNRHYEFQSNTEKKRRVLSYFFLGLQVIKREFRDLHPYEITQIFDSIRKQSWCYANFQF